MRGQSDKITILRILPYRNQPMNELTQLRSPALQPTHKDHTDSLRKPELAPLMLGMPSGCCPNW